MPFLDIPRDPLQDHLWDGHAWSTAPHARGPERIREPHRWHAFEHQHEEANWGRPHFHTADGQAVPS